MKLHTRPCMSTKLNGVWLHVRKLATALAFVVCPLVCCQSASALTPQTITFAQPATPALVSSTAPLTATASSGLAVVFSVVSGPATVSGTMVTYTGLGTVVIEADQPGNATYAPAPAVQHTVLTGYNTGTTSATQSATLTIQNAGTLGTIYVLTQGAQNLDFKFISGSADPNACVIGTAYAVAATCTVTYTFTPKFAGVRFGGIQLYSNAATPAFMGNAYVSGTGLAARVSFPGTQNNGTVAGGFVSTVLSAGYVNLSAITFDGSGNLYVADLGSGTVTEVMAVGGVVSTTSPTTLVGSGFTAPHGVAVDGSGDVFVADSTSVKEIVAVAGAVSSSSTVKTVGSGFSGPKGVAVDGGGDVFVADSTSVKEIVAVAGMVSPSSTVKTAGSGFSGPKGIALDGYGDVFIADSTSVKEIVATAGVVSTSSTVSTVSSGFTQFVTSVAVDGNGNVYVLDPTNVKLYEIVAVNGMVSSSSTVNVVANGVNNPICLTVDNIGGFVVGSAFGENVAAFESVVPSLNFASTNVGSTSIDSPQTVVLQNNGNAALNYTVPATIGALNPSISQGFTYSNSSTCTQTGSASSAFILAPNATCTEIVSFVPTTAGTITGAVVNTDNALNAVNATQSIPLNGTATAPAGPNASLTPSSLAFGNQTVGTGSGTLQLSLANNGSASLTITAISITGANPGDFSYVSTCGTAVNAGTTCQINVGFTPAAAGSRTATVSVTDNAPSSPQSATLTGIGTAVAAPVAALSPAALTFPTTNIGASSPSQTVTLSNTGNASLSITSYTASANFTVPTSTCGSALAAGATCTYSIVFSPSAAGPATGTFTVTDNASGSPQTASLTGTGASPAPVAVLSPVILTFPSTTVGTTAAAQILTLSNTGNASLTIATYVVSGSFAVQTTTCGSTLAPGAACSYSIVFTPTATGPATGTFTVTDNAPSSPQLASLTGTGAPAVPVAVLSPTNLTFPTTTVGATSSSQTVTLSNTGNSSLAITSAAASANFTVAATTCGATLAAGASCTYSIVFAPTATGAAMGTFSVTDNAPNSPQYASLTGTGAAAVPVASLSPNILTFPSTTVGSSSPLQTITLSNTGNGALTITSYVASANFTVAATSCGGTLSAGAACTYSIVFTPTAAGAATGTFSVIDNAPNSPQIASLSGIGTAAVATDFSITSPTPLQSTASGGISRFTITVAALSGSYNTPIVLTISGLPANATATFTPPTLTPGTTGGTSLLSIQTPPLLATSERPSSRLPWLAGLLVIPLFALRRKRPRLACLLGLGMLSSVLSGCGGGYFGDQAHTYTLTVTGTSGTLQHSTTLTLTVQ